MALFIQPSFAAGELSPALYGRVDLQKYSVGLAMCRNAYVQRYGGVSNRPGTRFIGEAKYADKKARLIPFQYSTEQTYVLEFGDYYVRFYRGGARIDDGGAPLELATPYSAEMLEELSYTQSADVLFLMHPDFPPKMLKRSGDMTWSLSDMEFIGGPFMDANESNVTVRASGVSGNITLTASSPLWKASDVGRLFKLGADVAAVTVFAVPNVPAYSAETNYAANDFCSHNGKIWHCLQSNTSGVTPAAGAHWEYAGPLGSSVSIEAPVFKGWDLSTQGFWNGSFTLQRQDADGAWKNVRTYSSCCNDGGSATGGARNYSDNGAVDEPALFRIYSTSFKGVQPDGAYVEDRGYITFIAEGGEFWGIVKITEITSTTVARGTVVNVLPTTAATKLWAKSAWSDANGWPRTAGFYAQRMVFAGTKAQPQTLWFSRPDAFNDFKTTSPSADDDAISLTLCSEQVNEIRHVFGLSDLQVFTAASEWKVSGADGVFTPESAQARPQTYYGTSRVHPAVYGNILVYVQDKGRAVRNHGYTLESDSYQGNDLSILAEHFFSGHKMVDMALQREPWGIVWCVREDGKLAGLTYLPQHDVTAWHLHETEGAFESVACVSGDSQDEVYFVVKRTVNGSVRRYVEALAHRLPEGDLKRAVFLDSALEYHAAEASLFSGLGHLAGCSVGVLADGFVLPEQVVSPEGTVTLPGGRPAKDVCIGLPYRSEIETLAVDMGTQSGTVQSRMKAIHKLTLRLHDSLGGRVGARAGGPLDMVKYRTNEDYGAHTRLKTGDADLIFPAGFDSWGQVYIVQDEPLPFTLLAVVPQFSVGM